MPLDEESVVPLAEAACAYCGTRVEGHRVIYACKAYLDATLELALEKERADILEFLSEEFEREERRAKDLLMSGNKEASSWAEERARACVWAADAIRAKEHPT